MSESADALIEEILSDARKQAERTKRKARRKAEKITSNAEEKADTERERILQDARQKADAEQGRIEALIPQQEKFIRSQAVENLLNHARQKGVEKVRELTKSDEYPDILCGLAVEAINQMSGDAFNLFLTETDGEKEGEGFAERVADVVQDELGRDVEVQISDETIKASGGLQIVGEGGHEVCDETFEARLERMWPRLRQEVAKTLSDGDLESLYALGEYGSD